MNEYRTCATCAARWVADKELYCRRHPPIPILERVPTRDLAGQTHIAVTQTSVWPVVKADWACYDHVAEGESTK